MSGIASVSIRRSDLFPVGQSVSIYPFGAFAGNGPTDAPHAAAIASGTVDAAGLLSVTDAAILSYTAYVAGANVGGTWKTARLRSTVDVHDYKTVVGTGDTTNGSFTILNASASSGAFVIGQRISGPGIRPGTLINNVVGGTLAIDQPASATATGVAIQGEGGGNWRAEVKRRKAAIGTT